MTQLTKLYLKLLASPRTPILFRDFERLLRGAGFVHDRTVGSHRQYVHPRVPRPFSVQPSDKDAKPYQVRQFLDMIEKFGLEIE